MRRNLGFSLRSVICFFQIFGTVIACAGLFAYLFYFSQIANSFGQNEIFGQVLAALILGILVYFTWKTIYSAVVIVQFVRKTNDADISANRFILSALSLNLGGLATPFMLTALPNVPVRSTINSRWFLSRTMGTISAVGAPLALIVFFLSAMLGGNKLSFAELSNSADWRVRTVLIAMLTSQLVIFAFGLLTVIFFYRKKANDIFSGPATGTRKMMRFIAVIWLIITTFELFMVMFLAVLRLLGAIADLTNSKGPFQSFMALFNLMLTAVMVGYILYTVGKTIEGIWADEGANYGAYGRLVEMEKERATRSESANRF